jgi:hypothetical protein
MAVTLALCYDLPKLYVSCLFLLSLLLLAPDLRRLVDLLFLDRAVEPAEVPPAAGRWSGGVLALLGLCVIAWSVAGAAPRWRELHPPKPPLYGAWNVEELTLLGEDPGEESAAPQRWRWAVFQNPGALDAVLRIGSRKRYALDLDMAEKTMTLDGSRLSFREPEPDVLVLEGPLDGRSTRVKLRRMRLSAPWFHWIVDFSRYE